MSLHPPAQKRSTRFSLFNKSKPDVLLQPPPPPPPKDIYSRALFSPSTVSLPASDSISSPYPPLEIQKRQNIFPATRASASSPVPSASGGSLNSYGRSGIDYFPSPSMDGTDSSGSCPNPNPTFDMYLPTPSSKPKKSVFKLANLAKRNKSKKDLSETTSVSGSIAKSLTSNECDGPLEKPDGDEGISPPWNFQHNIHVDEGYIGLPPSWSTALSQVGFNEDEIVAIHARRRAAATGTAPMPSISNPGGANTPEFPPASSSSNVLLAPAPRSTSLRKSRDALTVHPPPIGSPITIGRSSPVPSPITPSFSVKSFVNSIKNSLSGDSASMRDGLDTDSDQYILVDGHRGMADENIIDPYPYDTASISSHHTHASSTRQSQGQQTPRIPTFPQIQVQRVPSTGHLSIASSISRAPSPLAQSTSLPLSTPSRGYTYPLDATLSPSPAQSLAIGGSSSAPPRTPPKRIYHVANPSSGSSEGEPPPAYDSSKTEVLIPRKEKEGFDILAASSPPNRPIPPVPTQETLGEHSSSNNFDSGEEQEVTLPDTLDISGVNIPRTPNDVLDISSYYSDNLVNGADAEMEAQHARLSSPTPPLVIDRRLTNLAMLPPRISLHQEGSLDDWSESLFREIGSKGKRSSILIGSNDVDAKKERRTTIRSMSPPSLPDKDVSAMVSTSMPPETETPPSPSDISLAADLTLGLYARGIIDTVEEGDEQEQDESVVLEDDAEEEQAVGAHTTMTAEEAPIETPLTPLTPVPLEDSPRPDVLSLGKDIPASSLPSPPESPRRESVDSIPPSPPPKPKPKSQPAPLAIPPPVNLAPPGTNIITGLSGRSPVNSLFGAKPQPLPIPIPPSQIRAQLRPPPPKPYQSPPTLPLPPLKRLTSLPPPSPARSPSPSPSPRKTPLPNSTASQASPSDSRPNSSQTLLPQRVNGDRDSSVSMITVTPATIATAKAEVVRTAMASVIDSDTVSLASRRESLVSTAEAEPQTKDCDEPDMGDDSHRRERREAPGDSMTVETSSVSLLRDGAQSKWPTPPPPPVELVSDSTPRRLSRFRTTSLGRVTQLQAMGSNQATSPSSSHSSHSSSDTTGSTSESAPLTTPRGLNGLSPCQVSQPKATLAPEARLLSSTTNTFGGVDIEDKSAQDISEAPLHPSETPSVSVSTMQHRHPLLVQLQPHISQRDPMTCFTHLVEIAEGESGSVFAARVVADAPLPQDSTERPIPPETSHVAIKRIPLPSAEASPSLSDDAPVSNKVVSLLHELSLLQSLEHEHLLLLDGVYVAYDAEDTTSPSPSGAVDTSLWIRMELMERSLADVIGLVAEGLAMQERMIARFASDILHGLDYLQRQHIAHRDVRSDNLLVNAGGVVKIADFSNAIRVDRNAPTVSGAVGVIYWQAPEMRAGPYNALKVDIWSLGATVWELAETVPPFSTPASPATQVSFAMQTTRNIGPHWPQLSHPELYSRPFHEFLRLCGQDSAGRPSPGELLNTAFIRNPCGRGVILQLLSQCRAIEEAMAGQEDEVGVD